MSCAAAAAQLMDNYSAYSIPSQPNKANLIATAKQNANTYALRYGGYNGAGGVSSLTILGGDVQFGFTDAKGNFDTSYAGYPNTVQVVARRDSSANSPLNLFFAPVLGSKNMPLTATSSATIYTGLISSFDP